MSYSFFWPLFIECVLLTVLITFWVKFLDLQNSNLDRETCSTYECGFDTISSSRLPFSLRFFMILIVFILFDIELCLLTQLPFELHTYFFSSRLWYILFLFLILIGVFEENRRGVFRWKV